jgi:protein SCO1/2
VRATDARPSLYELDIALVDQHGKPRHFDTFRGHPTLLAMFYATCPSACPVLLNSIREMEKSLPEADRARLRVLLVSLDPAHDTPAVLADAGKLHGADPERWALCRAEPNDVRTLAAVLGVRYRAEKDGSIDHSSAVTLLSADGVVIAKVEGLGQSLEPIAAALHGGGPS